MQLSNEYVHQSFDSDYESLFIHAVCGQTWPAAHFHFQSSSQHKAINLSMARVKSNQR